MRNPQLEAAIWYLFTSTEFFEAAARECDETLEWFGTLAISRHVANFGRNNQIFDVFKTLARDFRRGAELARLGDYQLIWDTARCINGDVRGIDPDPDCPERRDDDDGFPGDEIVRVYSSNVNWYKGPSFWKLPDPPSEYVIDTSIACHTGEEVPWTGVWYPGTGLEYHSLAFAIKGLRMQPAFRVIKSKEELKAEGVSCPTAETVAIATIWHPVVPSGRQAETNKELWAKAGQPCPKAGIWQPTDPDVAQRTYEAGETMAQHGSAYGLTIWR